MCSARIFFNVCYFKQNNEIHKLPLIGTTETISMETELSDHEC